MHWLKFYHWGIFMSILMEELHDGIHRCEYHNVTTSHLVLFSFNSIFYKNYALINILSSESFLMFITELWWSCHHTYCNHIIVTCKFILWKVVFTYFTHNFQTVFFWGIKKCRKLRE
jgi:hypothetical protein